MPTYRLTVKIAQNNKDAVLRALPGAIKNSLNEIGDAIVKHTQEKVPVDTGALRDSYKKEVNSSAQTVSVGSTLDYSPFVELGTGPNYETPPDWVTNNAKRGYHLEDPWWYMGDDGEWHMGWFVRAQPHLRPAFTNHVDEYKRIFEKELKNA